MFSIGQKVVCIGDFSEAAAASWAETLGTEFPVLGRIYTIRAKVQRPSGDDVAYGVLLEEVLNLPSFLDRAGEGGSIDLDDPRLLSKPDETAFDSRAFRPLVTTEAFLSSAARSPAGAPAIA